jgi:hypothetical protein
LGSCDGAPRPGDSAPALQQLRTSPAEDFFRLAEIVYKILILLCFFRIALRHPLVTPRQFC